MTMRSSGLGGLAMLVAAVVAATMVPVIPVHGAAVGPIVPGISLADIPLGMRITEVVARLGAPSQVRLAAADGTLAYTFGQYGITAYTRANTVIALVSTNSLLATVQGIGLGAPAPAVAAAFGPAQATGIVEGFRGPLYATLGIAFGLDQETVAAVLIFPPIAAAPAVPSNPQAPATPPAINSLAPPDATGGVAEGAPAGAGSAPAAGAPDASAGARDAAPAVRSPARGAPSAAPPPTQTVVTRDGTSLVMPLVPAGAPGSAAPASAQPAGLLQPADPSAATPSRPEGAAIDPATAMAAMVPRVRSLQPFTYETQYLSLAGYLRYLIYSATRRWVRPEASEQFIRQSGAPSSP